MFLFIDVWKRTYTCSVHSLAAVKTGLIKWFNAVESYIGLNVQLRFQTETLMQDLDLYAEHSLLNHIKFC